MSSGSLYRLESVREFFGTPNNPLVGIVCCFGVTWTARAHELQRSCVADVAGMFAISLHLGGIVLSRYPRFEPAQNPWLSTGPGCVVADNVAWIIQTGPYLR